MTDMYTSDRQWQFGLRRLFGLVTGVGLAAGAAAILAQPAASRSVGTAITVRLLVVPAAGMIAGAFSGRIVMGVVGAISGMLVGDAAYVCLFRPDVAATSFAREFLLQPVLAISILPGAVASVRNRMVGTVTAAALAAAPLLACIAWAAVDQRYLHPNDYDLKWEGAGIAAILIAPAIVVGLAAWVAASLVIYSLEKWIAWRR
jgi:hypothetical protein